MYNQTISYVNQPQPTWFNYMRFLTNILNNQISTDLIWEKQKPAKSNCSSGITGNCYES